jgi:glycosyltransferase involved in cell wall biosynthesis
MNIVMVISSMNLGGAQRVVSIMCNYWVKNGHNVTLISTFLGVKRNYYRLDDGVKLRYIKDCVHSRRVSPIVLLKKIQTLRKMINEENPDMIISFLSRINVATILSTIGMNIPIIVSDRNYPPLRGVPFSLGFLQWIYRWIFSKANLLVVQTEESMSWIKKHYPNICVKVIPNPVSYPLVNTSPKKIPKEIVAPGKKVVFAAGRLVDSKQFDILINSFSTLSERHPNWNLVIAGEGVNKQQLMDQILKLGLLDKVYIIGRIGNIGDWYSYSDIFVLSSKHEGFPNSLLEAMSYGLAPISFDCDTGPRDLIINNFNGILVQPKLGGGGLSKAMNRLMSNNDIRMEIAKNSKITRNIFSVNSIMKLWDSEINI